MESISPNATAAMERAIDRLGDTDRQTLHPGSESARIVRLDEQMNVIGLHTELKQAKTACGRLRQGSSHHAEYRVAAQGPELRARAQCDMRRTPRKVPRTATMWDCTSSRARLPTRARAGTAPR